MSSNNLQHFVNCVDLPTIFLDRDQRVTLFSPAATALFDLKPTGYGSLISNISSYLQYDHLSADARKVMECSQPLEKEVSSVKGKIYQMRVLPCHTRENQISGVVITFFDTTRQKQVENELRASEERHRLLIESAKDYAIFTQDQGRHINSWNKGAEFMFGYTEEEAMGQLVDILFVPEDVAQGAPEKEIDKARKHGKAENERWHLRRDRSRFYGSGMVRPLFDEAGTLQGFVKVMRDLTEEKRSEEALRRNEELLRVTLESAVDYAIITLDTQGIITSWSRGAENIFGYLEAEATGKSGEIIFTPEDRKNNIPEKEMQTARQAGRALDERWHLKKDGRRFFVSGVMAPIVINKELAGYVKITRDLTEQRLLEQQKEEFIGIASHELKTPVTSIKIFAEALEERFAEKNDTESRNIMLKVNAQIDRLTRLISDLLDTTKMAEGNLPLNFEMFDITELIAEKMEDLQRMTKSHSLVLEGPSPLLLTADKERIGQVITNLITNAVKYSPKEGTVLISVTNNKEQVTVRVKDNGIGIPAELQQKVFERFFRVTGAKMQTYPGMGLGLYISAGIIHRHHGTIGVDSKEGEGSTFYFTLPVALKD